jgi:hypothetical protein
MKLLNNTHARARATTGNGGGGGGGGGSDRWSENVYENDGLVT